MKTNIREKMDEILSNNKYEYAYCTIFGSYLYGTNTDMSDEDFKALFWPSIDDLILQKKCDAISYATNKKGRLSTPNDYDIQFWSVQYWLQLLRKGDTNAIDVLFSMYTKDSVNKNKDYRARDILREFYNKPLELLDLRHNISYLHYANTQAKKYGLRGFRMNLLKDIADFLRTKLTPETEETKIVTYFDELLEKFYDQPYCFEKDTNGERCVWILSKGFTGSTALIDTINRLDAAYEKYGTRATLASKNEGIDWKSVSHALRCLRQVIELADTGFLVFPLSFAQEILDVKLGKCNWSTEVEPLITSLLDEARKKLEKIPENDRVLANHEKIVKLHYYA